MPLLLSVCMGGGGGVAVPGGTSGCTHWFGIAGGNGLHGLSQATGEEYCWWVRVVPLLTSAASAPWHPFHAGTGDASHSVIPMVVRSADPRHQLKGPYKRKSCTRPGFESMHSGHHRPRTVDPTPSPPPKKGVPSSGVGQVKIENFLWQSFFVTKSFIFTKKTSGFTPLGVWQPGTPQNRRGMAFAPALDLTTDLEVILVVDQVTVPHPHPGGNLSSTN